MSEVSQDQPGSSTYLRTLEALAFLTVKYAFSHFPGILVNLTNLFFWLDWHVY